MPTITENHKSRQLVKNTTGGTSTRNYSLKGFSDENSALAALSNYAPTTVDCGGSTLLQDSLTVTPVVVGDDTTKSVYTGVVQYAATELSLLTPPTEPEADGLVTGDFAERSEDIMYAKDVLHVAWNKAKDDWVYWPSMGAMEANNHAGLGNVHVKRYQRAINKYAPDQPTLGTQRNVPSSTFSVQKVFSAKEITNAWLYSRMSQIWTLNAFEFRGLPPRTVAFTGMSSQQRVDGSWTIDFSFEFRPFVRDFRLSREGSVFTVDDGDGLGNSEQEHPLWNGDGRVGFAMCAWDYLYVRDNSDSATGDVVIDSFSVCQLYDNSNFALLGV